MTHLIADRVRAFRALLATLGALLATGVAAAPAVPPGFVVEDLTPDHTFVNPTAIAFLPDGRLLVAEKRGTVRVVENGVLRATQVWNGMREVLDNGDRGLIGIAVDPRYTLNRRIYFFYTVDPDSDAVDTNVVAYTRIVRYRTSASDSNVVDPASRTVLLGATWRDGIPSPTLVHPVSCLRFGLDGSLLASHGENARHDRPDAGGWDPAEWGPNRADPIFDIGSFRSQDPASLAGKVLRINPENGMGYASNPFATGDLSATRAKVWAYGFRNPFRFTVRPGTGSPDTGAAAPGALYVSDVGANAWEEIDVVRAGGMNFGWPCREGLDAMPSYAALTPAHHGCSSIGTPANPALPSDATFAWHHEDSTRSEPPGLIGNCASATAFYTGSAYPAQFQGRLFFSDFGAGWMRVATLDSEHRVTAFQDFATGLQGPVDCAVDPISGDLFYVAIAAGEVRRIRYTGGEGPALPPVARASASTTVSVAPAAIEFSSIGSYDPQGEALRYGWTFGDGTPGSVEAHPSHVYREPGEYRAILTVSRSDGAFDRDTLHLVVLASPHHPATPVIDTFDRADGPVVAPWAGNLAGLAIDDSALVQTGTNNYAIWNGAQYGGNQEVFVRIGELSPTSPEFALLLKVQGLSWTTGCIQVGYNTQNASMALNTYAPGIGFVHRAGPWRGVRFAPGDRFGARALANGRVEIFQNDSVIATSSVGDWSFIGAGGRVGFMIKQSPTMRLEELGGGNLSLVTNQPPRAAILEPRDGAFFDEASPLFLRGDATDDHDPSTALAFRWDVSLRHNNHVHPSVGTIEGQSGWFDPEDHEDGTGTSLLVRLEVTDSRGRSADSTITLWPEVDLEPSAITTTPAIPIGVGTTEFRFALHNRGRMLARSSRWMLLADGVQIARGDTMVPGRDSVVVRRTLPSLATSTRSLRVVADTLAMVRETDETNNARVQSWLSAGFPSARVLDAFDRPDAGLAAPWTGSIAGLAIRRLALEPTRSVAYAVWSRESFGSDQEAFFRFERVSETAAEQDLLLKVQGPSWTAGCIQVLYSAAQRRVVVNTYAPGQGWVRRGGPWTGVRFANGERFGARVLPNGLVLVHRNGDVIGVASVAAWPFAAQGGRIGLLLSGASGARLIDFGGGDATTESNTPPSATILSPLDHDAYVTGLTLKLRGLGADAEQPAADLRHRWSFANGETTIVLSGATGLLTIPESHSGSARLALTVTDRCGFADTAAVDLHADVDLEPGPVTATPPAALGVGITRYRFVVRNRGRMPASAVTWTLTADDLWIADGAVDVPARDSATVECDAPSLAVGGHRMRLTVDSLDVVREPREDDNAITWWWPEVAFPHSVRLDDFERADGPLGSAWVGSMGAFAIRSGALALTGPSGYAIWNSVVGADQEVWADFDSVSATAAEQDLLLAVQGTSWTAGTVQIVYSAPQSLVVVNTYDPTAGWVRRGGPWRNVRLASGQRFGARLLASGIVRVYLGGAVIGECTVGSWRFAGAGGRIGLLLNGASATRIGQFGGGAIASHATEPAIALENASRSVTSEAQLSAVYPNPVRGAASFSLDLERSARVRFGVYDISGRLVWEERPRELPRGRALLRWPGRDQFGQPVIAGVYLVRVLVGRESLMRTLVVVR